MKTMPPENTRPKKAPAVHTAMDQFPSKNGELHIGGLSGGNGNGIGIRQLAARVGQTPFYAYDRQLLNDRVAELRQQLPNEISLHYAMKANPMPAVVQHFAGLVDGFDLASAAEMQVALDAGMHPDEISFAGPAKGLHELTMAVAAGVTVNLESELELERVAQAGEQLGITPRVAVRINPAFELKTAGMKMGGVASPFGIDSERVPAVLQRIAELQLNFRGFHLYAGSQNLRSDAVIETHNHTFALCAELAEHAPGAVHTLNIGGGFGIPYFPGEQRLDLTPVCENLERLLDEYSVFDDTEIVTELGRYLVGEAGLYVCEVIDRKESKGEVFLVTNGGLHHHLAASGNFGQVLRKNYPVAVATQMDSDDKEVVSVVGPLCTPLDLLGKKMLLPKAQPGDLIVVYQSGAYGYTASPRDFLSHPECAQVLV